jgi:hypothetical protein
MKSATMATHSPDYSDDDMDFDEEYFTRTYQPLSNLPTPPPSSRQSQPGQCPRGLLEDGGLLDSALLGMFCRMTSSGKLLFRGGS